ncbi:MAG TPA: RDD family protein [Thermodesulfobacteriota bacterium]|nr:RDD family protein [Thermodesulfobacteriota bacterium]
MEKFNTVHFKTPEGITFSLPLAGPMARFLAWVIDLACVSVIMMVVIIGIQFTEIVSFDFARAAAILSYFLVSTGYAIFCEWFYKGQTVGKQLMSVRVMDVQGLRLRLNQVVIRNLLRFIDSLPVCYLVGGLSCLLSPKSQRLGDLAANTIVAREIRILRPDLEQILSHKYNSLRDYSHLVARLRQRTSPHEANIALEALVRRNELDPLARVDLFTQFAAHFKKMITFPQETIDGITDEQFVRNVVDVLIQSFGTSGKTWSPTGKIRGSIETPTRANIPYQRTNSPTRRTRGPLGSG